METREGLLFNGPNCGGAKIEYEFMDQKMLCFVVEVF